MKLKSIVVFLLALVFNTESKPHRTRGFLWRQRHYHGRYQVSKQMSYIQSWHHSQAHEFLPTNQVFNQMFSKDDFIGRIIGGMNATSRQIPYQLRLIVKTTAKKIKACGAALVEAFGVQFALTAGHCIRDDPLTTAAAPDNMLLTAGKYNLKISSSSNQLRNPVSAITHELYKTYTNDRTYDIAILFFEPPFKLSSKVKTIELPEYHWAQPAKVEISGWGSTTDASNPNIPNILQVLEIQTMDNEECKRSFESKNNKVTQKMMCLLKPGVKVGACVGDSGGPARALNTTNGRWYLAGLSSYHLGACRNGRSPSVYLIRKVFKNFGFYS